MFSPEYYSFQTFPKREISETTQGLQHEYPNEPDIYPQLQADAQKLSVSMEGDEFHKNWYTKIAPTISRLTDFDFPISGATQLSTLVMKEAMALVIFSSACRILTATPAANTGASIDFGLTAASILGGLLLAKKGLYLLYMKNKLRTSPSAKLELDEEPYSENMRWEDRTFVIQKLNQLEDSAALSFDEAIPTIYKAVTKLTEAMDGYTIPLTPRVKKAIFPDLLIRYGGTLGWFVPLFQEICVVNENYPEAIAHEVAHRTGIPEEKQAQLIGVAALIQSDNQFLQYLGYRDWLGLIMDVDVIDIREKILQEQKASGIKIPTRERRKKNMQRLYERYGELGLNQRTLHELNQRDEEFIETAQTHNPIGLLKQNFEFAFQDFALKTAGQSKVIQAYTTEPLALLHAYRLHYLH